jgi:probable addiction module antidote protein
MTKRKPASVSHDDYVTERIKRDPEFAAEYLKAAFEEATDDTGQKVLLVAIRHIAQARGIASVARAAGIKRESLSRALSPRGNPRLDTLCAIVQAMGLQLTVEPAHR